MFVPTTLNLRHFYYPIGNTPATCLTRSLPPEADATVLLLGCGDLRNLLFTSYADDRLDRAWDITFCDYEPAVIARNILLISLIIDGSAIDDELWDVYYHFRITPAVLRRLHRQAGKLAALTTTSAAWSSGCYSHIVRIASATSLPLLHKLFTRWAAQSAEVIGPAQAKLARIFNAELKLYSDSRRKSLVQTVKLLNLGPVSERQLLELFTSHVRFEELGTVREPFGDQRCANPTYVAGDGKTFAHYGSNPLFGFHLLLASTSLAADSPLRMPGHEGASLYETARGEFSAWVAAFKRRLGRDSNRPVLRFLISDALVLGHALQARTQPAEARPTFYYGQDTFDVLALDDDIPAAFSVIDTSNLVDHLGAINILAAAGPLLTHSSAATLHTEMILRCYLSLPRLLEEQLCQTDVGTVSLLFGLFPVKYWTDTSNSSHRVTLGDGFRGEGGLPAELRTDAENRASSTPAVLRLTWKRSPSAALMDGRPTRFMLLPHELAEMLYAIYCGMFVADDPLACLLNLTALNLAFHSTPKYTRAGFVAAVSAVRHTVDTDWDAAMKSLASHMLGDRALLFAPVHVQEVFLYMHLFSLFSHPSVQKLPSEMRPGDCYPDVDPSRACRGLRAMPAAVCVTLRVPRRALRVFTTSMSTKDVGKPKFRGVLQARGAPRFPPMQLRLLGLMGLVPQPDWRYHFATIQVCFGDAKQDGNGPVTVVEDNAGWAGTSSPLIVSFLTPTWILLRDPANILVTFSVSETAHSLAIFLKKLGIGLDIFSAGLSDTANVLISKTWPNKRGTAMLGSPATARAVPSSTAARLSQGITYQQGVKAFPGIEGLGLMSSTSTIYAGPLKDALTSGADIVCELVSPCKHLVTIGAHPPLTLRFPCPLRNSYPHIGNCIDMRVTTNDENVPTVGTRGPVADRIEGTFYPDFLCPIDLAVLGVSQPTPVSTTTPLPVPVLLNMSRSNLDAWPRLDMAGRSADVNWLVEHAKSMFSAPEMRLRRHMEADNPDRAPWFRVPLKAKLFLIVVIFSAMRSERARPFALRNASTGQMEVLVMPDALRLDLDAQTVVLDAALVVPPHSGGPAGVALRHCLASAIVLACAEHELRAWRAFLPACTERCRVWSHGPRCEYIEQQATKGLAPGSTRPDVHVLCSCGRSIFPDDWGRRVAVGGGWDAIRPLATRAAIGLVFSADPEPTVEAVGRNGNSRSSSSSSSSSSHPDTGPGPAAAGLRKCHRCGSVKETVKLCARCRETWYCGGKCQREDWKSHKRDCKEARKEKRQSGQ